MLSQKRTWSEISEHAPNISKFYDSQTWQLWQCDLSFVVHEGGFMVYREKQYFWGLETSTGKLCLLQEVIILYTI